jgi:hypothetical protein
MRNGPNRLRMAESDDEPSVHEFKKAALCLHGRVRRLIQETTHLSIAVRGSMTVIDAGTLLVSRTRAHPGGEAFGGGEGGRHRAYLGDDLLRRIHAEAGHGREPFHGVLVDAQQAHKFLVELLKVRLKPNLFSDFVGRICRSRTCRRPSSSRR